MEELQASKGNPIDCATAKKINLKSSTPRAARLAAAKRGKI